MNNDLAEPMPLARVIREILDPASRELPARMDSLKARLMLLTIGQQESLFKFRRQMNNGPAMGFWQFEEGGGVKGVLNHAASKPFIEHVLAKLGIPAERRALWLALQVNDQLAAIVARLLLYTDAKALPEIDDVEGSWKYYERTWRPGKPHPEDWEDNHRRARVALGIA